MIALETLNILELAMAVLGMISAIISAVESPGNGAQKKTEAIARVKEVMADLPLPQWARAIFSNSTVLGMLIDLLVRAANNKGLFSKSLAVSVQAAAPGDTAGNASAPVSSIAQ